VLFVILLLKLFCYLTELYIICITIFKSGIELALVRAGLN